MYKTVINVPSGIRYISEWKDFKLPEIPTIINKQLCGCGFTEWCIKSPYNIILCSPRKILLENKEDQHQGDVLYARNELDIVLNTDKDISSKTPSSKNDNKDDLLKYTDDDINKCIYSLKQSVINYSTRCLVQNVPCKILVTYDSFRHVRDALGELFLNFYVVVDEFQSIFTDARFKSSTELEFLNTLKGFDRLCFVSATPMVDEYLEMMDEFKDLPFIELDWKALDESRLVKPKLNIYPCKSILSVASREIKSYIDGNFKKKLRKDRLGNVCEIESRELVIYVNSVRNICEIIKRNGLTIANTNVLCSRTGENITKLRQAFGITKTKDPVNYVTGGIGRVPKRGEPHKMFTLCTRTVYLGADFYSTCARSIILSDANSDCMSVDISLDLPQIIGRQRLDENPWMDMADFYFKTSIRTTKELNDFINLINRKKESTEKLLRGYEEVSDDVKPALVDKYESDLVTMNYRDDYIAVNKHAGSSKIPVFNNLVMLSEIRAYEIQKLDYKDRFSVMARINYDNEVLNEDYVAALDKFNTLLQFTDKMKVLCENPEIVENVPYEFSNYYYALGPERIGACQYRKYLLEDELQKLYSVQDNSKALVDTVISQFKPGERYTKSEIKEKFKAIYNSLGIKTSPKALSIKEYFEVKDVLFYDKVTKKRDGGYEILKRIV